MIRFEDISFKFEERKIFENFNLSINNNEKVAIIGESGAGKTTFLNLLAGFEIPQKGKIFYDDIELKKSSIQKIRQKIAWLPQNFNVPFENVKDLFYYPFNLKLNSKLKPDNSQIEFVFDKLGIEIDLLKKNIDEISGGQKQRIMLASIFFLKKPYLFLDEPSSALDENSTLKLTDLLFSLEQVTVIAATHDKTFIDKSQRVINLSDLS